MVVISTAITTIFGAITALFGAITTTLPSKVLNTKNVYDASRILSRIHQSAKSLLLGYIPVIPQSSCRYYQSSLAVYETILS